MKPDLIVIGCGSAKLQRPAMARNLYTGQLFVARRNYAEATSVPYLIASAKHRLITPSHVVEPYDMRLPTDRSELRTWAWLSPPVGSAPTFNGITGNPGPDR